MNRFGITVERAEEIARHLAEKAKSPPKRIKLTRAEALDYWREPIQAMIKAGYTVSMIADELAHLHAPISAVTISKAIRAKAAEKSRQKRRAPTKSAASDFRNTSSEKLDVSANEGKNKGASKPIESPIDRSARIGMATPDMLADDF